MTLPTAEDVNKAREQATHALGGAIEQARTPLLAALGAGDVAARAVLDTLNRLREQADSARAELVTDPAELRKRFDEYAQSAARLYGYLADRGEETLSRIRAAAGDEEATTAPSSERAEQPEDISDDVLGAPRGGRGATAKKSGNSAKSANSAKARTPKAQTTTQTSNGQRTETE